MFGDNGEPASTPRLLVIQPDPKALLDDFTQWLAEEGVQLRTLRPYAGEDVPRQLIGADAVLVMGGSMSSLDDARYPWLEDIRVLLRDAHHAGRPALGICLGAQLMAQAHGGSVAVGGQGIEGGLIEVCWLGATADDPLVGGLPNPFPVGALHGDAVEVLPPGSHWLACNTTYPHQAFRVGDTSWGLQFHPEVSPKTMNMWLSCMREEEGIDLPDLTSRAAQFERRHHHVQKGTAALARRFARMIPTS